MAENGDNLAGGYGQGGVDTVLSVGDVAREAEALARAVPRAEILSLVADELLLHLRPAVTSPLCATSRSRPRSPRASLSSGPTAPASRRSSRCSARSRTARPRRRRCTRCHEAVAERKAQGCRHRLYPAGQFSLSRHDGRGKPVDGRLSAGRSREGASGGGARIFALRPSRTDAAPSEAGVLSGGERRLLEISQGADHGSAGAAGR